LTDIRCPFQKCSFNVKGKCVADEIALSLVYLEGNAYVVCRAFKPRRKKRPLRSKLV